MNPRAEKFSNSHSEGVALHALHWGDDASPIVVLLHGGGANAHWWDHIARPLARSYHLVALDFRGHGDSDHPEMLQTGAFNCDLEALCEALGTQRVTLVGHSMGAHVALDHAARHPDTHGLVLIDLARGGSKRSSRVARLALSLRRSYASPQEAISRFRFVPAAEHVEATLAESIARHSLGEESDGRFGFKFDPRWFGVPPHPKPDPSRVRCPTLLVRGGESTLLSHEAAASLVEELPRGQLIEIASAGHHVLLDQPAALIHALEAFLAQTA